MRKPFRPPPSRGQACPENAISAGNQTAAARGEYEGKLKRTVEFIYNGDLAGMRHSISRTAKYREDTRRPWFPE
jgi:ketol-acid reductoisomerase